MSWTLLVLGYGRWELLARTLASVDATAGLGFFGRRILSLDTADPPDVSALPGVWEVLTTGRRSGLVANLQQGWDSLGPDEWVFHLEEDFEVRDAPLDAMRAVLKSHPAVAQMVLERQPYAPFELAHGSLVGADHVPTWFDRDGWREQPHLFSFNPCVYHSSVATKAGTETSVTQRLRGDGRTFGFWGAQGDEPRCVHLDLAGMGSPGWSV